MQINYTTFLKGKMNTFFDFKIFVVAQAKAQCDAVPKGNLHYYPMFKTKIHSWVCLFYMGGITLIRSNFF
jgi:hypothetical protein